MNFGLPKNGFLSDVFRMNPLIFQIHLSNGWFGFEAKQ